MKAVSEPTCTRSESHPIVVEVDVDVTPHPHRLTTVIKTGDPRHLAILDEMAKDYLRACQACGTTWLLPKALAKEREPDSLEMLGRNMMATGSSMTPFSSARTSDQLKLTAAREQRARAAANSQCPSCGSSRFTQAPAGSRRAAMLVAEAKDKAAAIPTSDLPPPPDVAVQMTHEDLAVIQELKDLHSQGLITDETLKAAVERQVGTGVQPAAIDRSQDGIADGVHPHPTSANDETSGCLRGLFAVLAIALVFLVAVMFLVSGDDSDSKTSGTEQAGTTDPKAVAFLRAVAVVKNAKPVDVDQIVKNPDAYIDSPFVMTVHVTQFDSATGACSFRAEWDNTEQDSYYDWAGDNAIFTSGDGGGSCTALERLDEDDTARVWATGAGSQSYQARGDTGSTRLSVVCGLGFCELGRYPI